MSPPPDPAVLLRDRTLFARICEFNSHPARYVDRTRVAAWCDAGVFERLAKCPRGSRHLSRWILSKLSTGKQSWFDFSDPRRRLALWPGPRIAALRDYVAAAVSADDLRKAVDRPTRTRILERLGKPLLEFAEKRAPFVVGSATVPVEGSLRDALEKFEQRGRTCLASWFGGLPAPIAERVSLKLPPPDVPDLSQPPDEATAATLWRLTRKIGEIVFPAEWGALQE